MIVGQFDDSSEHLVDLPSGSDSTIDEAREREVERFLTSNEAVRIILGDIWRIYLVHVMNMTGSRETVKKTEWITSHTTGVVSEGT
ncbi:hypothetical protein GGE16_003516 [Rhizobium leguminosarum]|uniref:Uncharacterized protein n=1 Tax=Rhizobium leguminosarum TaxID=384 RepID=A0AAE2MLL4_RHILE|nr:MULTISPECIES: hypothetical protein [Rhizobium]MBB4291457.1 hypothetical protein [Rhizobium leguminosarum]MBB4296154.1 hypothetical protein [Rhizobium leguminosarum]MBB4308587.1 hypothetical protein [Rhizobium leguminosarum]MBB4416422.1 hypothetical protein [Rhizobium leguminosarum]MBB4430611.1 hypothetical protein [Rhizobium esperanzae]